MKNYAFTLSEVLITLGIIGVVSTLTLPNLTNSYRRNVAMTKIEKGYAQIAQAYEQMLDDIGDAPAGEFKAFLESQSEEEGYENRNQNARNYFNKYWANYLKSPIFCETFQDCGYSSDTPFSAYDGSAVNNMHVIDLQRRATFMTNEGIVYMVGFNGYNPPVGPGNNLELIALSGARYVYMDINGGKAPNAFGRDLFVLEKTETDGLMPYHYNMANPPIQSWYEMCKNYTNNFPKGHACLEYLRRTGWEPARDYKF